MQAGFSRPSDADADDVAIWMSWPGGVTSLMDRCAARYILENISDEFLSLVRQEREATTWAEANGG